MNRPLVICGPTASGKTAVAVAIAKAAPPAALINADSRQTMHTLTRATFQPTGGELQGIPCHLAGVRAPDEEWTAATWCWNAEQCLRTLAEQHVWSIVVGGTGLYVRGLANGYSFPGDAPDPHSRRELEQQWSRGSGRERLLEEVGRAGVAVQAPFDAANPRRVIRALERMRSGVAAVPRDEASRGFGIYGIWVPKAILLDRIRKRVEWMFRSGAVADDIADGRNAGLADGVIAGSGIGYREWLACEAGLCSTEDAISRAVQRTARYAKQQRTWFRHEPGIEWILGDRHTADIAGEILHREHVRAASIG